MSPNVTFGTFNPIDFSSALWGSTPISSLDGSPDPLAADGLDSYDANLPEAEKQRLKGFIDASNDPNAVQNMSPQMQQLIQALHQAELNPQAMKGLLEKLEHSNQSFKVGNENLSAQDLAQMLADYFANFFQNEQNKQHQQPPRMLGNLNSGTSSGGGGGSPGGGPISTSGSGGGGGGGASAASGPSVSTGQAPTVPPDPNATANAKAFLDKVRSQMTPQQQKEIDNALSMLGMPYIYGGKASASDAHPPGLDCSGFANWAVGRAGGQMNLATSTSAGGTPISMQQALHTPGALLIKPGDGPNGHIVISVGDGQHTIEAMGTQYGIRIGNVRSEFTYAVLPNGIPLNQVNG